MNKEIFRDIKGYESLYQISNLGRVKSLGNGNSNASQLKILKPKKNSGGYYIVNLCKNGKLKNYLIARLVGIHFIPNPENKPEINHKKGIKIDNRATELEWSTSSENRKHAYKTGLQNALSVTGEKQWNAKLNEKQVRVLKWWKIINPKITLREVAKVFNVTQATINQIFLRRAWKHIII